MTEHDKHPCRNGLGILAVLWSCRYLLLPVLVPGAMSSEVFIMVSTVPAEFVVYDAIVAAVVAVIVCFFTFLWRYVEHNDAEALDRESNPMKLKFIGGTVLAMVVTALLAYLASSALVGYFNVAEPVAADYCIFAALTALIFGIAFTIIFSEGITAFGKFLAQKVKEVKTAVEDIPPEVLQALLKDFQAKKAMEDAPAEDAPEKE